MPAEEISTTVDEGSLIGCPCPRLLIRDSIAAFLRNRSFVVSPTRFTSITTLYKHWRNFERLAGQASNTTPRHFHAALGRVLRPKNGDGSWRGVLKRRKMYGISAPGVEWVDVTKEAQKRKNENGMKLRKALIGDPGVEKLREERATRRKRLEGRDCTREVRRSDLPVNFGHVDEFVAGLECAPDLLALKLYPNGKELTESMSAFAAVRRYMMNGQSDGKFEVLRAKDQTVTVLVVGDGCTPRTAAMFAFRTSWRCVSIDPLLRCEQDKPYTKVKRLELVQAKVQHTKVVIKGNDKPGKVVVVAWHAHVSLVAALKCIAWEDGESLASLDAEFRERVGVVCCSCCNWGAQQSGLPDGSPPDEEYEDGGVSSLMRTVRVWRVLKPGFLSRSNKVPEPRHELTENVDDQRNCI